MHFMKLLYMMRESQYFNETEVQSSNHSVNIYVIWWSFGNNKGESSLNPDSRSCICLKWLEMFFWVVDVIVGIIRENS